MLNEGGQIAHLTFGGVRKGGGGGDPGIFMSRPLTVTDPTSGKQFTQETNPYLLNAGIKAPGITSTDARADLNAFQTQQTAEQTKASQDAQTKAANDAASAETNFQTARGTATENARQNQFSSSNNRTCQLTSSCR